MSAGLLLALLLAVPAAEVTPATAWPGDAVLVTVTDAAAPPSGTLGGRPLQFWAAGPGRWRAVAPLPIETAPGLAPVELVADGLPVGAALEVLPHAWRTATLSVPPKFVEPPPAARKRMALDQAAFDAVWARPFASPSYAGSMRRPLPGVEVSSWFGDQRRYNGKLEGTHYGLDLAGPAGAPVEAAADGEVVLARDCYMTGLTVVLAHGPALFTVYFHQSKLEVKVGDRVVQGQVIGRVGSTGRSTGAHLHWGIKSGGLYVNPERFPSLDPEAEAAPEAGTHAVAEAAARTVEAGAGAGAGAAAEPPAPAADVKLRDAAAKPTPATEPAPSPMPAASTR